MNTNYFNSIFNSMYYYYRIYNSVATNKIIHNSNEVRDLLLQGSFPGF